CAWTFVFVLVGTLGSHAAQRPPPLVSHDRVPKSDTSAAAAAMSAPAMQIVARARDGRADVPRVELAARLKAAGLEATADYAAMRTDAARELSGRPDRVGTVSTDELAAADRAIAQTVAILERGAPTPSFCELARAPGRPQIPGLRIVYL